MNDAIDLHLLPYPTMKPPRISLDRAKYLILEAASKAMMRQFMEDGIAEKEDLSLAALDAVNAFDDALVGVGIGTDWVAH